ncbi:XrtA/PEP-CTERM system histidine kinase PrsK [Alkalimonas mucilaginosa]|uniref:histidine kinase n=1 Tax=Alkalimonas mucilaginosa TaxID=3057676 RepID=A0ABU7JBL8_9GAMM|nr:XrtA/PEP-CTERM system histidine kinase PrsK [Alkalimonas sp. MEB004]MEE2022880.1 PEP-CTERM system histidine kinase PrsK [Alkalimonas sp. MEB004]
MQEFWSQLALDKIGFSLTAAGYLFFFALLLSVKARNVPRTLLIGYTLVTVCWALVYALAAHAPYQSSWSIWLENSRLLLLILFLYAALHNTHALLATFFQRKVVWLSCLLLISWTLLAQLEILPLHLLLSGQLLICIFVLALLEALYRRSGEARWQFKPLIIALGVVILFDFVLLAEGSLFRQVDAQLWSARSFIQLLMLPMLVIAVRRIKAWNIRVYISRDIVLQSSLVFGAGAYLCLLALAGFYIRYSGGAWSELLQAIFIVLGFALLTALVLSDGVRRKLRVFIEKHFFENTFDYRVKWLELTHRLRQIDVNNDKVHQETLQAWLQAIGYTRGILLRLDPQPRALARINRPELTAEEYRIIDGYIRDHQHSNWIIDLQQAHDPFVQAMKLSAANIDTQLIIPIRAKDGLWGLCLLNAEANLQLKLNWELKDYLIAVTEQIASYLFLLEATKQLMENAQFAAFSRMSAFVVHDLKNITAQLGLLQKNAERHKDNPEFIEDAFETIAASKRRMDKMLAQLMNKERTDETDSRFEVGELIQQLIHNRCQGQHPIPTLAEHAPVSIRLDKERFANVLFHLIDNAQYATPENGSVSIELSQKRDFLVLTITDTGCGMSPDFIQQRLFKPFDSTKGNAGMGIGAYDALVFAQQSGGALEVQSEVGLGTTFTMRLPLNY